MSGTTAHEVLAALAAHERVRGEVPAILVSLDLIDRVLAEHTRVRQGRGISPAVTDGISPNVAHPALDVRPDGSTERTT